MFVCVFAHVRVRVQRHCVRLCVSMCVCMCVCEGILRAKVAFLCWKTFYGSEIIVFDGILVRQWVLRVWACAHMCNVCVAKLI